MPSAVNCVLANSRSAISPTRRSPPSSASMCGGEVAVVAAQQDVGVVVDQRVEGALDADVDDLLVGAPGQRDRPVVHRQQRLHERQSAAGRWRR